MINTNIFAKYVIQATKRNIEAIYLFNNESWSYSVYHEDSNEIINFMNLILRDSIKYILNNKPNLTYSFWSFQHSIFIAYSAFYRHFFFLPKRKLWINIQTKNHISIFFTEYPGLQYFSSTFQCFCSIRNQPSYKIIINFWQILQ